MIDPVSLGWQITALIIAGFATWVLRHLIGGAKEALELRALIDKNHNETKAWLNDQRNAHAKILEDHLNRLKLLEPRLGVLEARTTSLEQVNEVTKTPPAPGAIGPFLPKRKAGTQ